MAIDLDTRLRTIVGAGAKKLETARGFTTVALTLADDATAIGELGHAMESMLEAVVEQRCELDRTGIGLLEGAGIQVVHHGQQLGDGLLGLQVEQ